MLKPNKPFLKNRKVEPEKELKPAGSWENFVPRKKPSAFELAYAAHDGKIEVEKLTLAAKKIYEQFSKDELKAYQPKPDHRFSFNPHNADKLPGRVFKKTFNFRGNTRNG